MPRAGRAANPCRRAPPRFKKIFLIDLGQVDQNGFVLKSEVADLMNLSDPDDIGRTGTGLFTFPFVTIESVIPLSPTTLGVLNDNNYPFSSGRNRDGRTTTSSS